MSDHPPRADLGDRRRPRPAVGAGDAQVGWAAVVGGLLVLAISILVAVAGWQLAGDPVPSLTPDELTEMETLLAGLGFPPGVIDGAIDDASRNAISDFQLTVGLEVNGEPSTALLDELRAAHAELSGN